MADGGKLRVAAFLTGDFPEGAAPTGRIKCYAQGLRDEGHEVSLFFLWPHALGIGRVNAERQGTWEGIPFRYFSWTTRPLRSPGRKLVTAVAAVVGSSIYLVRNHKRFDVLYLYRPFVRHFLHVYLLAAVLGVPVVIEQTELPSSLYRERSWRRRVRRLLNAVDERVTHHFVGHCIVISRRLFDHYEGRYPAGHLHLISAMVDPERFRPGTGRQRTYLAGYLGSFEAKDNVPGLVGAFAEARKTLPALRLRLMGSCVHEGEVARLVRGQRVEDAVEMTGPVSARDLPRVLAECDLLIMNRIDSPYAQHGFPSKLGEYLATGTPVIATRVSDVEEYLRDEEDALLIGAGDDAALADAIVRRYRRDDHYRDVGLRGRQAALRHFSHRRGVAELVRICRLALTAAPRSSPRPAGAVRGT